MNRPPSPPNLAVTILLYTVGVILVITAILLLLKGFGVVGPIPGYVIWALLLLAVGVGILGGLKSVM